MFVSTDPTGGVSAWTAHGDVGSSYPRLISCPSASLCVAVAGEGTFAVTTDPMTSGSWHAYTPPGYSYTEKRIRDLSCPTSKLCVAIDNAGNAVVSIDPANSQPTWTATSIDAKPLTGLSCPSELLCTAVDNQGGVVTSTNPAGGAWTSVVDVDQNAALLPNGYPLVAPGPGEVLGVPAGAPDLTGVSCPSVGLCVAVDAYGNAVTTTTPTGGASAWNVGVVAPPADALEAMSCPTASLCVALDDAGRVAVSTDPAAPQPTWSVVTLPGLADGYSGWIACTSQPVCLAADTSYVPFHVQPEPAYVTTDPGGGAGAWKHIESLRFPVGTLCPWRRLCIDTSHEPLIVESLSKKGHVSSRTPLPVGDGESCPASFCIAGGTNGAIRVAAHPTTGVWTTESIDQAPSSVLTGQKAGIQDVSCPTATFCVAYDDAGNVLFSTRPTAGATFWTSIHPSLPYSLTRLSCPSVSLCVGTDGLGDVIATDDPVAPATWAATLVDPAGYISSLSCASVSLCLAGDATGNVLTGIGPPAPSPTGVSRAAALSALKRALLDSCTHRRVRRILAAGGCPTLFAAPGAGTVTLIWRLPSRQVIARGSARTTRSDRLVVHVRLDRAGRRLLRSSHARVDVRVVASFKDAANHLYVKTRTFRLAH